MTDRITRAIAALSSRRSASRARTIVVLDEHDGAMLATELAHACGWDTNRLNHVIYGDGVDFSVERSPYALGQIVAEETKHGVLFVLTELGKDEARALHREAHWKRGRGRRRRASGSHRV